MLEQKNLLAHESLNIIRYEGCRRSWSTWIRALPNRPKR